MQPIKLKDRIQYHDIQKKRDVSAFKIFVWTGMLAIGSMLAVGIYKLVEFIFF